MIHLLLSIEGIDIDLTNNAGGTPQYIAAKNGQTEAIAMLINQENIILKMSMNRHLYISQ